MTTRGYFLALPFGEKLKLIFYPVVLVLSMPVAWCQALWAARILMYGQWRRYMGFFPLNAINSFFYRTQWLNLDRYGRDGISPVIGSGRFLLSRWFHLSLLASCVYANAGAITTLLGTLGWVFSHLVWVDAKEPEWVLAITLTLFFSSTSYAMAFRKQNYQILGWLWFPMALYAVSQGYWGLASLLWFAMSVFGITHVFFSGPIVVVLAVQQGIWQPLITIVPAVVNIYACSLPMLQSGRLGRSVRDIAKLIGATGSDVRYKRKSKYFGITNSYYLVLYGVGCGCIWVVQSEFPVLPFVGLVLFAGNQRVIRVADEQSVVILFNSLMAVQLLQHPPIWIGLAVLWFVASPLPILLEINGRNQESEPVSVRVHAPFDHSILEDELEDFLLQVPKNQRVMMAFEDPGRAYENIFDGHRVFMEMSLFVAARKGIHLFPDWHFITENNYENAPDTWGRTMPDVLRKSKEWDSDYVMIYQETGSSLAPQWNESFESLGQFDWGEYTDLLRGELPRFGALKPPKWFLLRRRETLDQSLPTHAR